METTPRGTPSSVSKLHREDQDTVNSISSLTNSSVNGVYAPGIIHEVAPEVTGLRASMESAIDKVRARRHSVDDRGMEQGGSDDSRRLSTLVSKTKRKVKKKLKVGDTDSEHALSVNSGSRLDLEELEGNHSDSSLLHYESGRSSLLTDDDRSDPDG